MVLTKECPVRCRYNLNGFCTEGTCVNYALYREWTGKCETCGAPMAEHPRCEACGMLSGEGHMTTVSPCRGRKICLYCQNSWSRLEKFAKRLGLERGVEFEEFLRPSLLLIGTQDGRILLRTSEASLPDGEEDNEE